MKKLITVFLFLIALNVPAVVATHGMVVFGESETYLYHLPMFHQIHNKQVVLALKPNAELLAVLKSKAQKNFLTFVPAPFDLDLFLENPTKLTGELYIGHFEKDGILIKKSLTLEVDHVEFILPLTDENEIESFVFFGKNQDYYAIHLINSKEKIDQIAKIKISNLDEINFSEAITDHLKLEANALLENGKSYNFNYSVRSDEGCRPYPTRLCGTRYKQVTTKLTVKSIYFQDEVM